MVADWAVGRGYRLVGRHDEAVGWLKRTLAVAEKRHAEKPGAEANEWVGWCAYDLGEARCGQGLEEEGGALMRRGREALVEAKIGEWWPERLKEIDTRLESISPG